MTTYPEIHPILKNHMLITHETRRSQIANPAPRLELELLRPSRHCGQFLSTVTTGQSNHNATASNLFLRFQESVQPFRDRQYNY